MELRHLRYFAAVAETRHFGRAADRLHMAQPALSQSIRQLEAELGTPLFVRTTRQVRLTPAGEFFQVEVARILDAVEAGVRGVRRIAAGRQGLVRIAFTGSAAHTQLPRMARIVKRELPGMALEIHADLLTPAQVAGLHRGQPRPRRAASADARRRARRTAPSRPSRWCWRSPPTTAWPTEPVVSMADLRTERVRPLRRLQTPRSTTPSCAAARAAGFVPDPRARGGRHLGAAAARRSRPRRRAGPCLGPRRPLAGVVFRDVTDAATVDLALVWRADETNPAVLAVPRRAVSADVPPCPSPTPTRSSDEDHPASRRSPSPSPTASR